MLKGKKMLALAFVSLIITGCATATTSTESKQMAAKSALSKGGSIDAAAVKQAIADAKAAQKKAASVEGEWRDVGKFIKKAEKALKKGDLDTAMKLAKKARVQSELGYKQAMEQRKSASMSLYIP